MRVWLVGQKWLAAETLRLCRRRGHKVVGVTAPAADTRLADAARAAGVMPSGGVSAESVRAADTTLILAAHAHIFVSSEVRQAAALGCLGYHPSLLPLHRGRDAVRWAIHMRERITGGTVYWLNDRVDAGPIAAQAWSFIRPDDTPASLWRRELGPMGARLFGEVLAELEAGHRSARDQDEAMATWEPSFDRAPLHRTGEP